MGPYLFSCLYMNLPMRSGDMLFDIEWFKYFENPPRNLMVYTTVDPAGDPEDSKGDPDYNVVMTCGKHMYTGRIYVLEYFRAKCNPGDLIHAIFRHVKKYKPIKVMIEAVAYQKALQYFVRERMKKERLYFSVEGIIHNRRSKNSRISGLQPVFASGNIFLREHHKELESELLAFPLGKNDDLADALSMQLGLWALTSTLTKSDPDKLSDDPFNLESILAEVDQEQKKKNSSRGSAKKLISRRSTQSYNPFRFGF